MTREAELAKRLVSAVRSVIGEQSAVLHEPTFSGKETEYLKELTTSANTKNEIGTTNRIFIKLIGS